MIKIDFENTFDLMDVAEDLSFITFKSNLKNGAEVLIKVKIAHLGDPLLPNVYNLCFGPLNSANEINDTIKLNHSNTDRLFSTILLFGLTFLEKRPDIIIGIDGSNDVRAYLYHRMFITNRQYLNEYFVTIGVDWYVRLLRKGQIELDDDGLAFFKPKPEPFDYKRSTADLYRYYMFHKKV